MSFIAWFSSGVTKVSFSGFSKSTIPSLAKYSTTVCIPIFSRTVTGTVLSDCCIAYLKDTKPLYLNG